MRIVTNVSPLLSPLTGIGHYTNQLLNCLTASAELEELCGVSPFAFYSPVELEQLLSNGGQEPVVTAGKVKYRREALRALAKRIPFARSVKRLIQDRTAKRESARFKDHLYWEPNFTLLPLANPCVTTVHDLSHIHFPQYHPAERVDLLNKSLASSIERANRIVAVSEYTKQDIVACFGVGADKIDVVSPAVSDSFRRQYSDAEVDLIRQRYGLPENYILSVATLEPRKNIEGLIHAYRQLPQLLRRHFPLVLVGLKGWLTDELERLLKPLQESGQVVRLGYVEQEHLPIIYQQADCLAYVSFFEGYGMPVAEAMAAGVPVVTANNSSMPEVAAGVAKLVNAESVDDIAQGLQQVIDDKQLRKSMSEQGRQQAQTYTWQASADRLVDVFQTVYAEL